MRRFPRTLARALVVAGAAIACAAAFVASAPAAPPDQGGPVDVTLDPVTLSGVCAFDIQVQANARYRWTYVFDQNGLQTLGLLHVDEQDTFSANGKTLVSDWFTWEGRYTFANGALTHVYSIGVTERIPLPGGGVFVSAGQVVDPTLPFTVTPTIGGSGDVSAFCAALS